MMAISDGGTLCLHSRTAACMIPTDVGQGRGPLHTARARTWPLKARDTQLTYTLLGTPSCGGLSQFQGISLGSDHPREMLWEMLQPLC